mmetsp:Transcript_107885/g.305170  ORF Transcript_107885/g.305170 Transcript_107885/m.305170 type:complete len:113 (+) Transcript_107885:247-585(+)
MEGDYSEAELLGRASHNVECQAVLESFTKTTKKKVVSVRRVQNVRLWRMYADQRELVRGKSINDGKASGSPRTASTRQAATLRLLPAATACSSLSEQRWASSARTTAPAGVR